jgi:heptosyltransferase II
MKEEKLASFKGARKILVRSANWVGDAVMSLPAIASARLSFPGAEISILAKPWVGELFQGSSEIDRLILYRSPGIHDGIRGRLKLAGELKAGRFDLVLHLPNSFDSALVSFLAGIPRRAGYKTDGRGMLLTDGVPVDGAKNRHQVEYYLHLMEELGFRLAGRAPVLQISPQQREDSQRILESCGLKNEDPLVGVAPGAKYGSAKEWFPERYGEVAARISGETGSRVLVLGSAGDRPAASRILQEAGTAAIDLTGKTSLGQAMALIARCRLFITNDSGLMHVASALAVPLVALFGSTDPARTGPLSDKSRVLRKPIPCGPCLKPECPKERECMSLISADEVFEAVKEMWTAR